MLEREFFRWRRKSAFGWIDFTLVKNEELLETHSKHTKSLKRLAPSPMLEREIADAAGLAGMVDVSRKVLVEHEDVIPTKLCDEIYLDDTKIKDRHPLHVAAFLDEAARRQYKKFYVYPFARLRLAFYAGKIEWKDRGDNDDPYTPEKLRETAEAIRQNFSNIVAMKLEG